MPEEKKQPPLDISALGTKTAAEKGAEMQLLEPFTGQPTGAVLMVLGFDSDTAKSASRDFSRMAMRDTKNKQNPDEVLARRRIFMAERVITGGHSFVYKGKELVIPSDEFREVLNNPDFEWIASQVERFGTSRGNYTPEGLGAQQSGRNTSGS